MGRQELASSSEWRSTCRFARSIDSLDLLPATLDLAPGIDLCVYVGDST
jgi:hypothetical protein